MTVLDHPVDQLAPTRSTAAPTHELIVRPWWDPGLAERGVDPRSAYVERYWLGVLGPSAVFLIRRLARGLEEHPNGFKIALADTARAIGLGGGTGKQSPMNRTIDRACMFGAMRRIGDDELSVRTRLPRLTPRQLNRLPLAVRTSHDDWIARASELADPGPAAA